MPKIEAHVRYRNIRNKVVPGVTTIIGLLNKPQLVTWANQLGLKGIDSNKYRDEMAEIGDLAHRMILADLRGEVVETGGNSFDQISKAKNCFASYLNWKSRREILPILIEQQLVSNEWQYGGTLDYYGYIDYVIALGDYKTGGIWREAYIQTCAYHHLLVENGYDPPQKIIILGFPRTNDEKFQEIIYTNFELGWEIFKHLRELYDLLNRIG